MISDLHFSCTSLGRGDIKGQWGGARKYKAQEGGSVAILRGSVPKNGPIDCASKNHFSLNSADGKGLVPKY